MMKRLTAVVAGALALAALAAQAGVAPALGGNKMSASGAKIAPPSKPAAEEQKEEKSSEQKEQPKQ